MALPVRFDNTVFQAGFAGTDDGAPSAGFGIDDVSANPLTVNGTVNQVGDPITVTGILPGQTTSSTTTFYATQYDSSNAIQFNNSQNGPYNRENTRLILSNTRIPDGSRFASDGDTTLNNYTAPVCFTTGTLIRTAQGDVLIEDLSVGDLVVTASGQERPIRWIGHRTMDCRQRGLQTDIRPIRISAGAFEENRPARDLIVSPGHSIAINVLGEVLIPASALVNGTTITQQNVDSVTYWHIELDSHDILIAEGQPAESYLEMGNRGFFASSTAGSTVVDLIAGPDTELGARTHSDFCRPYHDSGRLVEFVRERVQSRAAAQGWHLSNAEPWAGVYLMADGGRIEPEVHGTTARFSAPAGAQDLWLVSPAASPSEIGMSTDSRQLGLRLAELRLGDGWNAQAVSLDDPLLCVGFHGTEGEAGSLRRWTAGRARLPAALWSDQDRALILRLDPAMGALPRWVKLASAEEIMDRDIQDRSAA
jgi:hypothetical protein